MTSRGETSPLLQAAIAYAQRGWPVFPCKHTNKVPLLPRDKDAEGKPIIGSGGVTKASCDEAMIRSWWRKWPNAMIGIAVGRGNMLVVDFDPRVIERTDEETGEITKEEWTLDQLKTELEEMMGCALPASLAVRTPSGGVHIYFRMPEGAPIGNRGNLPDHVDVRGLGGYVIGPPSKCIGDAHNAAGDYRWLRGDASAEIVDMPAPLVEILRSPTRAKAAERATPRRMAPSVPIAADVGDVQRRYAMRALDEECRELEATPIGGGQWGGRNQGIYHAALKMGGLVGAGAISETIVRASLEAVVRAMPSNNDLAGALQTIENGLANGQAKPRDLSAVGAHMTRGRASGRSADPSDIPPEPPIEAYDDFTRLDRPAPDDDEDSSEPFHPGSPAEDDHAWGSGARIKVDPDPDADRECAFFPATDLGNAERFRRRYGWKFRFSKELGWFVWDDRRWELLSEEKDKVPGEVSLAVFRTVRAIRNEADLVRRSGIKGEDENGLDFIVRWKGSGDSKVPIMYSDTLDAHEKSSEGSQRLGCIANLAKSFADIAIKPDAMDRDRMAINVLNGTLRMVPDSNRVKIELKAHDPRDLISKIANVTYDPKATSETFDGFLATVQPKESNRRFILQWHGYSMTGDISEQKLLFNWGKGRNGKSTLTDITGSIAGDYGGSIAIESLLDQGRGRKGGEATPDLARLPGIRYLRTSEPEKGAKLAEALIKLITGGEPIDARFLNKGFFSFLPAFKVTVSGNHRPKITGHDDGIWRRMMLVPWSVQIAKEDVDKDLPKKLLKEASGIFNRLIEGLLDWRENGLIEPDDVLEATKKYRESSDQLGRFLEDCVRPKVGAKSKSSLLFNLFVAWSKATGGAEWKQVGFSKAMEDRGYEKLQSNGMQWVDIEMIKTEADFPNEGSSGSGYDRDGDHDAPPDDRWDDLPP